MASNSHDRTKLETGDQISERVGLTREPALSYDENGNRLRANEIYDRPESEENAIIEAQVRARGNRRDDVNEETVPSDLE